MPSFDIGTVLNRFFRLLGENFGLFALLGLFGVILPAVLLTFGIFSVLGNVMTATDPMIAYAQMFAGPALGVTVIGGILVFVASLVVLSAITEVAILRAVGKPVDLGAVFGQGLRNALPLLVISILVGLMVMAGTLALIIPGIFLALATCVAIPSYVGEPGRGIIGSISRSFELTKGRRWWLLLIFIVVIVLSFVLGTVLSLLTMPLMFINGVPSETTSPATMMPYLMANAFVDGIFRVLGFVLVAAIYVCLRESREKLTPDNAAEVFK